MIFWWTLMNILIGFLGKISNSNLNFYIVHLWANQCSRDPYVDGESFKIEKLVLSVVPRSCLCLVLVMSRCCFGVVSVMSRSCLGRVLVLSWSYLGGVSVLFWWCLGVVLVLFCCFFGGVLGIFQWCVGDVSGMFRWSLHDVWWWCCDVYDDEWVMAWCCLVDVAVLFLLLWWWCFDFLMTIDEHFDRDSKQNLKFQFEFVYCAPLGKPV